MMMGTDSERSISMLLRTAFLELFRLLMKLTMDKAKFMEPVFSKMIKQYFGTYLPQNLEIRKVPRTDSERSISMLLRTAFLELSRLFLRP